MPRDCTDPFAKKDKTSGFTLIVSIFLLTILVVLGSSLSMLTMIEMRQVIYQKNLASARSNAELGVALALDQLQQTAGPDQRVTAPSGVWKDEAGKINPNAQQHWTGVWHSQKRSWDPSLHEWVQDGREQDPFNGELEWMSQAPTNVQRQSWLISGNHKKIPADNKREWISPENISGFAHKVQIHTGSEPEDHVQVPAVILARPVNGKPGRATEKRYAYWVADEGTKLKVNLREDPESSYPQATTAAARDIRDRLPLMSLRKTVLETEDEEKNKLLEEEVRRLISPGTLKATSEEIDDSWMIGHDFTSYSKGVLCDVSRGGLKKDLSRGLGDQFVEKLVARPLWQEALPQRGADGKILNLESFRKRQDFNADKEKPEQHRQFLRGPLWDIAHSWYSLYLPRPPFLPAFNGGARKLFQRKYEPWDPPPADPVGGQKDPGLYQYHPNTNNWGPTSSLQSGLANASMEPRNGGTNGRNQWLFANAFRSGHHSTRDFYTNKPRWIHKKRIDLNAAANPAGGFYRRENLRHPIAPVMIEATVKIGLFAVDATYLWDLRRRSNDHESQFWRYLCETCKNPLDKTPNENVDPLDPMPVCPVCDNADSMGFTNGFDKFGRPKNKTYPLYHLDKTKARREILEHLIVDPGFQATLSGLGHNISSAKLLMAHNGGPLDMEKHSLGLRNGNELEQAAYLMMRNMFKLQMINRPYIVYWNPYNVKLKNVEPAVDIHLGNGLGRFNTDSSLNLPDAHFTTSNGPLQFFFPALNNRGEKWWSTPHFTWMGAFHTAFVNRFTDDFHTFNGTPIKPPQPRNFRPNHDVANRSFHHSDSRLQFICKSLNSRPDSEYDFEPGEIKIYTPLLNQRSVDWWQGILSPGMDEGLMYSMPLSTRFLKRGETIESLVLHVPKNEDYDQRVKRWPNNRGGTTNYHRYSWSIRNFLHGSDRATAKKDYKNARKSRLVVSFMDRLMPDPAKTDGRVINVSRNVEDLVLVDYEQFDWWNRLKASNEDRETGRLKQERPREPIASRLFNRYQGPRADMRAHQNHKPWANPYIQDVIDAASIRDDLFFACVSMQRRAMNSDEKDGLPSWTQFNPRALSIHRNSESESTPMGWDVDILSMDEARSTGRIQNAESGIPRWGPKFGTGGLQRIALVDVPRQPMHSLVEFTHADLGNFQVMPAFATGNSYASPFIPPNQSYTNQGQYNLTPSLNFKSERSKEYAYFFAFNYCLPDVSYHLNKALFDRYFFSTIPDAAWDSEAKNKNVQFIPNRYPPFESFDQDFINKHYSSPKPEQYLLPNPRMRYYTSDGTPPKYEKIHDFDNAAAHLLVDGAFNVNSTSVKAWKSLLRGLSGAPFRHGMGNFTDSSHTPFLRSIHPARGENDPWQGFPAITDQQLENLAQAIVEEVKSRGPFLSLADFVNRRLVNTKAPRPGQHPLHALSGTIQSAIDRTINNQKTVTDKLGSPSDFKTSGSFWSPGVNFFKDHLAGSVHGKSVQGAGLPGWLMQSDILRPLAPVLNARSDTFIIRGYGDVKTRTTTRVKALCEAVVQRVPDYVNPDFNDAADTPFSPNLEWMPWYTPDPSLEPRNFDRNQLVKPRIADASLTPRDRRLQENFILGRRFKIVHFRWL